MRSTEALAFGKRLQGAVFGSDEKAAAGAVQMHDPAGVLADARAETSQQAPAAAPAVDGSYELVPPERNGKFDWEKWMINFSARLSSVDGKNLPYLLGDNEKQIAAYKRAMGPAVAGALDALIKRQWERIG